MAAPEAPGSMRAKGLLEHGATSKRRAYSHIWED
jgi:hypothetical protein